MIQEAIIRYLRKHRQESLSPKAVLFDICLLYTSYLYHLYDYTQESIYKEKAERLLDDLLENDLSKNAELTVEEGLCGVALGLDYIVKKQFVDGDINDLLSGIDDLLFKKLVFGNMAVSYTHLDVYKRQPLDGIRH